MTLFIVFDVSIRQLTLLNDTKQLIANACKTREIFLPDWSFKDEIEMNGLLHMTFGGEGWWQSVT